MVILIFNREFKAVMIIIEHYLSKILRLYQAAQPLLCRLRIYSKTEFQNQDDSVCYLPNST